ncbi:MAG: nitrilase-related carbon-nitrogen hydrolase [bacterium]|nr:nitrilase-related carbon-nitrogen hydrolase [bacterium]
MSRRLGEKIWREFLTWRCREAPVRRSLARRAYPHPADRPAVEPGRLRVAAVQVKIRGFGGPDEYAGAMYRALLPAIEAGAQLVAFPEEIATGLLGLLPGFGRLLESGSIEEALAPGLKVADVFAFADPAVRRVYHATFSELARRAGVWVAAGSANLVGEDGRVYNEARLYGPDGALAGRQRKVNLMGMERDWGLAGGDRFEAFDLESTRVAIPVCNEAGYWETFRLLALDGVEVVVVPQADTDEYNPWNHLRGAWGRVQESPVYAVVSCMVGEMAGIRLTGKSGVLAPLQLSPGGDGVLARVDDARGEGMAVADLDLAALRVYRRESGVLAGLRPDVYARYLPRLYGGVPMAGGKILTVPEELREPRISFPTGNEYVSLPLIGPGAGAIDRPNCLSMAAMGLLEFAGLPDEPFLRPTVAVDGRPLSLAVCSWERLGYWLPRFRVTDPERGLAVQGTIFAPPGHKGFVYVLEARSDGKVESSFELGLEGCWGGTLQTVYTSRPVSGERALWLDRWTGAPVLEIRAGLGLAALGFAASHPLTVCEAGGGEPARFRMGVTLPGPRASVAFYVGVNREADGARTTAVDLARRGWESLLEQSLDWLDGRAGELADPGLTRIMNLNAFFNYFYALGETIDSEDLVMVTSRSPLYYVSAAFWARDALLWSLPGVLLVDPARARDMVVTAFTRYRRHAGVHSLYLDGSLLYPGFELDELCAYPLALERYLGATGDRGILEEPGVREGLAEVESRFWAWRHPRVDLFGTMLCPSDDPATHPYLTYGNALAWRALEFLGRVGLEAGLAPDAVRRCRETAPRVRQAVYDHLVTEGPRGPMFAWSADLEGAREIYDEPPGSLQLLAYYGFCDPTDPVYRNTVAWVHSPDNPHHYPGARFPEVGCPHADHPFVMGIFNSLLSGRAAVAREILLAAPLDGGLACESFDRETGVAKTGAAFATCAGFLAYALHQAFGREAADRESGRD